MKKLVLIFGLLCSVYCHSDNNSAISEIRHINKSLSVEEVNQIYDFETKYAKQYDIPVAIGLSISAKESTFKSNAVSGSKQSIGIKQINYKVWKKELNLTKDCLKSTECNIKHGYIILKYYVDINKGDINKALMNYRGSTNPKTNRKYAQDVLKWSRHFT